MPTGISPRWAKSDHVKRPLTEADKEAEDAEFFRAAIGKVDPLPDQSRIVQQARKPMFRAAAFPPAAIPDTLSDSCAENAPEEYLSNGLSRMTLRKLRRGYWPIEDSLDLHGCNTDSARKLLQEFLHEATQHGLRCVLVIHGKGMNSGEGLLRRLTRHWLAQHPAALAYCNAPEGGSGAALVLLKRSLRE